MDTRTDNIIVRPPFRGLRLIVSLTCLCVSAWLGWILFGPGYATLQVVLSFSVILAGGLMIGFFERTVIISKKEGYARIEYRLFGLTLHKTDKISLAGMDGIKVANQRYDVIPEPGTVMVADTVFSVWCMKGTETLFVVIGKEPFKKREGRFFFYVTPFFNSAWFESNSRHVGAILAGKLNLPLEYEPLDRVFAAKEIPAEWFDPQSVKAILKWRRTF